MNPVLEEALNINIKDYNEAHEKKALPHPIPYKMKNLCISAIDARIEALEAEDQMQGEEYEECSFLSNALKNGWLVSDIEMLRSIFKAVNTSAEGRKAKVDGRKMLDQLNSVKMDTVVKRFEMMTLLYQYCLDYSFTTQNVKDAKKLVESRHKKNVIYASEYPNDKDFEGFAEMDEGVAKLSFLSIVNDHDKNQKYQGMRGRDARETEEYVLSEMSSEEIREEKNQRFIPNPGQRHNDIKKSSSTVIKEVFGEDIYDEINDMKTGSYEERKIPLYHSLGTKYQKQGHDVLEIEFAGSGAEDVAKVHKGRDGSIDTKNLLPEDIEKRYGKKVSKGNGKYFDYIRSFDKPYKNSEGKEFQRKRYAIAGATPNWGFISGLFNLGEYSIENTKVYAQRFAKDLIEPLFKKWEKGEELPHDINILLTGHSRGAVAAGQAAKKINEWVKKYTDAHPKCKEFAKFIKYDLKLIDPVPGMITDLHLSSCDLSNIPNMNATVMCSLAQEHTDLLFPLQYVKGVKKIVLTTTDHLMDIWTTDESQKLIAGDGKKHASGYYDAETGEMYRGSGMSQMPDGIYVSDEKHNLVRVTSYSQLSKLFKATYGDVSPQRTRCKNIHYMVRDWFVENQLDMSFPDEKTRDELKEKNRNVEDRILNSPNKRIAPIKNEIKRLREMKDMEASKEDIIAQNKKIIEVCKTYMKKTRIPASGDSEYRVDLVSDLLSFTMRENNQLSTELSIEKGETKETELDAKIKRHNERMEKKEGFAQRKVAQEKNRLRKEEEILTKVKETAKLCKDQLGILDKTRVGKLTSEEYDDFRDALVEGSKLGEDSSMKDIIEFYKKLTKVSDQYVLTHDSLLGPITNDGQKRLESAKAFSEYGKKVGKEIEDKAVFFGDKDITIGARIKSRKETVEDLKDRTEKQLKVASDKKAKKVETAKKKLGR